MAANTVRKADGDQPNRPRRPNAETMAYLRSLPLDPNVATDEINNFLQPDDNTDKHRDAVVEYPSSLIAALSCVDDINKEVASLAGDEYAAEFIEVLARLTVPYSEIAARKLLASCSGYAVHLAKHRYGSHVLQTLLQLTVKSKSESDLALHQDAPQLDQNGLLSLTDLLLGFQEELLPYASDLAVHICGAHVLRTLCCIFGGVELKTDHPESQRRGKIKPKKKKKKPSSVDSESTAFPHAHMCYLVRPRIRTADFQVALQQLVEAISGSTVKPPGDLQQLSCHSSGGPLLMVLLRVLTYADAADEWGPQLKQIEEKLDTADRHLGLLRPEPTFKLGSKAHSLANRLLCWQYDQEKQPYTGDVIYGLSGEPRGSHVLETILRLSPNELYASILHLGEFGKTNTMKDYVDHEVANFVVQMVLATVRTAEQAESMIDALEPVVRSGFVLDADNKRRGIVWRLVEMIARHRVGQERVLLSIRMGFASVIGKTTPIMMEDVVSKLLIPQRPEDFGDRLVLNVGGSRAIYNLLRFDTRYIKGVLRGIVGLPEEELELIAKDGLGSRCVLDGVFDRSNNDMVFAKSVKQLLTKLQGRWVALSVDRVGHHTVKKLFRSLGDMESRECLVQELSEGLGLLSGNAIGRAVMDACAVREYKCKGTDEWHRIVQKRILKEEWLEEMLSDDKEVVSAKIEFDGPPPESKESTKKRRKSAELGLDSIMEVMSIPKKCRDKML